MLLHKQEERSSWVELNNKLKEYDKEQKMTQRK